MKLSGSFRVGHAYAEGTDTSEANSVRYLNHLIKILDDTFYEIPLISRYGFVTHDDVIHFEFEVVV